MKKTNYSKIAHKYDSNKQRLNNPPDLILANYLNSKKYQEYNILDIACGTGNYLKTQTKTFYGHNIKWFAIDASEDMLEIAKEKVNNVEFINSRADEKLPYESEMFDYISNNFAFHHFENKKKSLEEIKRVLKKGGILKMSNVAPEYMDKWWVYQCFPTSKIEDKKRFWDIDLINYELDKLGFKVNISINTQINKVKVSEIYNEAINRDTSQLDITDNTDYEIGLDNLKFIINKNPNLEITNEFAIMNCIAEKI